MNNDNGPNKADITIEEDVEDAWITFTTYVRGRIEEHHVSKDDGVDRDNDSSV